MTRPASAVHVTYTGDGTTDTFPIEADGTAIYFRADEHIRATEYDADGVAVSVVFGTHYDISGGPDAGILTRLDGNLPVGYKLTIWRQQPIEQDLDVSTGGDFNSAEIEDGFDRTVEVLQELDARKLEADDIASNFIVLASGAVVPKSGAVYSASAGLSGTASGSGASEITDTATNTIAYPDYAVHDTTETPTTGFGVGRKDSLPNDAGTLTDAAAQAHYWTDATEGSEDTGYTHQLQIAGTLSEVHRVVGGRHYFPLAATTASGANAYLDSGSTPANELKRSTSSERYKRAIEDMSPEAARAYLNLRVIYYRSAIPTDPQDWSYWGVLAEDLAKIDPRLVQYGYQSGDLEERVEEHDGVKHRVVVPKAGAQKVPDGVAYDRMSVVTLKLVQLQAAEIEAIRARLDQASVAPAAPAALQPTEPTSAAEVVDQIARAAIDMLAGEIAAVRDMAGRQTAVGPRQDAPVSTEMADRIAALERRVVEMATADLATAEAPPPFLTGGERLPVAEPAPPAPVGDAVMGTLRAMQEQIDGLSRQVSALLHQPPQVADPVDLSGIEKWFKDTHDYQLHLAEQISRQQMEIDGLKTQFAVLGQPMPAPATSPASEAPTVEIVRPSVDEIKAQALARVRAAGATRRGDALGRDADGRDVAVRMMSLGYRAKAANPSAQAALEELSRERGCAWSDVADEAIMTYARGDLVVVRTLAIEAGAAADIMAAECSAESAQRIADQAVAAIEVVTGERDGRTE